MGNPSRLAIARSIVNFYKSPKEMRLFFIEACFRLPEAPVLVAAMTAIVEGRRTSSLREKAAAALTYWRAARAYGNATNALLVLLFESGPMKSAPRPAHVPAPACDHDTILRAISKGSFPVRVDHLGVRN